MMLLDRCLRDDLLHLHRRHARLYRLAALCVRKRVGIAAWPVHSRGAVFVTTHPGAVAVLAQQFVDDDLIPAVQDGVLDAVRSVTACVAALAQPERYCITFMWDLGLVDDKYTALHNLRQFVNANTRAALARQGFEMHHNFDPYITAPRPVKPRHTSLLRPGNGTPPSVQILETACRFAITDHLRLTPQGRRIPCPYEGFAPADLRRLLSQTC